MYSFRGKHAIVTGAGSGIGKELALALGRAGARVWVTDIEAARVDEVVGELKGLGSDAAGSTVDHSDYEAVTELRDKFIEDWGHVDVICSNAGVGMGGRVEELTIEDWRWLVGINVWGSIYMTHLFVPGMIEAGRGGRILITASALGLQGAPATAPYTMSKFGMVGLAEALRIELGQHDIGVSALCPGIIATNIVRDGKILLADEEGETQQDPVAEFYDRFGTHPSVVAKDGLKAMAKDIGIMPSPLHVWPLYLLRRVSPELYTGLMKFVWKKGWVL